jgi:hypothetical protein
MRAVHLGTRAFSGWLLGVSGLNMALVQQLRGVVRPWSTFGLAHSLERPEAVSEREAPIYFRLSASL